MATRREPDDAHPLRVDLPFPSVLSDGADGLLRIKERHLRAPCRQAVFQHDTQDAVSIEPTRDPVAFRAGDQPAVSAARADDHSNPIGLRCRMNGQTGVLRTSPPTGSIWSLIGPEREFGRRGGFCGKGGRARQAQQCCDERVKEFPTGMHGGNSARVGIKRKPPDAVDDRDSTVAGWPRCPR